MFTTVMPATNFAASSSVIARVSLRKSRVRASTVIGRSMISLLVRLPTRLVLATQPSSGLMTNGLSSTTSSFLSGVGETAVVGALWAKACVSNAKSSAMLPSVHLIVWFSFIRRGVGYMNEGNPPPWVRSRKRASRGVRVWRIGKKFTDRKMKLNVSFLVNTHSENCGLVIVATPPAEWGGNVSPNRCAALPGLGAGHPPRRSSKISFCFSSFHRHGINHQQQNPDILRCHRCRFRRRRRPDRLYPGAGGRESSHARGRPQLRPGEGDGHVPDERPGAAGRHQHPGQAVRILRRHDRRRLAGSR